MRVAIFADTPGWIVDRITDEMIRRMPFEFTKRFYTQVGAEEFVRICNSHDLVHYQNWDIGHLLGVLPRVVTPFLLSVRSHRYPNYVLEAVKFATAVHGVNPDICSEFDDGSGVSVGADKTHYIPDGVFDLIRTSPDRPFTVGFVGKPDDYKGFNLVHQACRELDVRFRPATGDVAPHSMPYYYHSVDLVVCASVAEGFSTVVMECLTINKPVITPRTGVPHHLPDEVMEGKYIERSVEGIKAGIRRYYTAPVVDLRFHWGTVCREFEGLYRAITKR